MCECFSSYLGRASLPGLVFVYALYESFFLTGLKDEHVSAVTPEQKLLFSHIHLMYFSSSVAAVAAHCFLISWF